MAVVINTVYGMSFAWALTHIFNKVLKVIPSFADFYTPAKISMIAFFIWISAPMSHHKPNVIKRMFDISEIRPVLPTTAALRFFIYQVAGSNKSFCAAFTDTKNLPVFCRWAFPDWAKNKPFVNSFTDQNIIGGFTHG